MVPQSVTERKTFSTGKEGILSAVKRHVQWKEEQKERKWQWIENTPEARQQAIQQGAMFFTTTSFAEAYAGGNGRPEPIRYGDLCLDFDDKDHPENAFAEMKALCLVHLPEEFSTDPNEVRYYASGSKGFHAILPSQWFDASSGDPLLPLIYKRIVADWRNRFDLPTLDMSLYCMGQGRMFRIENVKRSNGRYKVPLTLEEVRTLSMEEITELTMAPREVESYESVPGEVEELGNLYRETQRIVHAEAAEKPEAAPISDADRKRLSDSCPPCVGHILTALPGKTEHVNFNKLVMLLISYFQMAGFSKADATAKVAPFLERYNDSASYDTPQKRSQHWRVIWDYLSGNDRYTWDCRFVLGFHLPGGAFDCKKCKSIGEGEEPEQTFQPEEENKDPESWPVLAEEAIYGDLINAFLPAASEHSEADPAAVLMTFLARFSAEVGNVPFMYVGDGKHHVNLLTAISGTTGGGRKGTSATPVKRLFKIGSTDYIPATVTPGPLSSGEGIIFAVRDPVMKWKTDKKSGAGEWVADDPGVEDKRLFVLSEELGSAFRAMEREGNTLSTIIRQIYDSGDLAPLTKSNKITATGAHISVVGHITFFELNRLLDTNEIHNGLINRFLWTCSKRQKIVPFPKPIPNDDLIRMRNQLRDILDFSRTVTEMKFSDESRIMWANVYPGLSRQRDGLIGDILVRAPGHVTRLSMLYALLDKTAIIYPCHIEAAMALWSYCEQSARYIFESQATGDPLQNRILLALSDGPKTATEISNSLGRNIRAKEINGAIKALIEQCRVEMVIEKGNGRPSKKYKVLTK